MLSEKWQVMHKPFAYLTCEMVNGLASESVSIDQRGNATTNRVFRNRASAEEIAWVKYPTSTTPAVTTSTNGLVRSSTSQTGVTTTFTYDAFQREVSQTDGRGNTTRIAYDSLGRVTSTIDALGYATTYGYDALGRQVSVTDPLTNTVTTAYDAEGHVVSQRGATYPVDYAYDEFGEKVSMTTYRDINAAGDVTRWLRDEATGLVTNKVYADGKGPRYTYTPDGRLATRTWARGIVTTYSYDDNGALTNTVYSDGTPTISLAYNRAGRQIQAIDAAGVTTFLYDEYGSLTNETVRCTRGALAAWQGEESTNVVSRFYDSFGRDAGYSLNGVRQSTLAYDPATGRLASMHTGRTGVPPVLNEEPFTWSYLPGSNLKSSLAYPNGLTASWQYDANGQLLQAKNAFPTNTISQYDYTYDAAGRRVQIARSGSAMSENRTDVYGYNARGELIFSRGDAEGAENDFAYEYDDIGNRLTSLDLGTNRTYIANNLNQYTSISNSAFSASPREAFIPQFDDDGNQTLIQTSTGIWQVQYNGENRPTLWSCIQSNNSNNTNNQTILSMSYDRMGRRVTKNAQRFVYDGYLQIANFEHSTSNIELQTFIWDPTEPVATRPLVWNRDTSSAYYSHDANKNVSEVVSGEGEVSARYEYAPFGSVLVIHGEMASSNPWRFSSEYDDDISGLVYYNFRNYNAIYGRWVGRDPVAEKGCINLYCMLENQILYSYDFLGLKVSWASRDLSSFFLGNHQFIIFEYDSKDDAPLSVRKLLKEVKCKKTRCKVYVATIGLEQRPLEVDGQKQKHMIWWYVNESEDIEAYKEQFCKKDKRKHFWDWDYQANEIEGFDEPKLVDKIMEGFENFKNNIKDKPTKYDLWDLNCATWVNSLLKYAGVDENQREEKGEFSGIDWGEEDEGLESYFKN